MNKVQPYIVVLEKGLVWLTYNGVNIRPIQ